MSVASMVSPSPFADPLSQWQRASIKTSVIGEGKAAGGKSQSLVHGVLQHEGEVKVYMPCANLTRPGRWTLGVLLGEQIVVTT